MSKYLEWVRRVWTVRFSSGRKFGQFKFGGKVYER